MNGCAPGLALKERLKVTRKWSIPPTQVHIFNCVRAKYYPIWPINYAPVTIILTIPTLLKVLSLIWLETCQQIFHPDIKFHDAELTLCQCSELLYNIFIVIIFWYLVHAVLVALPFNYFHLVNKKLILAKCKPE